MKNIIEENEYMKQDMIEENEDMIKEIEQLILNDQEEKKQR